MFDADKALQKKFGTSYRLTYGTLRLRDLMDRHHHAVTLMPAWETWTLRYAGTTLTTKRLTAWEMWWVVQGVLQTQEDPLVGLTTGEDYEPLAFTPAQPIAKKRRVASRPARRKR